MLPLQKCRQLLGSQNPLTDSELESLCACLYQLAQTVVETPIRLQNQQQAHEDQHRQAREK